MADKKLKKQKFDGEEVEVLGPTYEQGTPKEGSQDNTYNWRAKLRSRKERLAYLETGERYWFSDDWYGSEKRKKKA